MVSLPFSKKEGLWPVSLRNRISRPVWQALGHCQGLGSVVLERQFHQWKDGKRKTIPAALVTSRLGDHLTGCVSPQKLDKRLAAVKYTGQGQIQYDFRNQFIASGNLEPLLNPICKSRLNREIDELFASGMDWHKTQSYQNLRKQLQDSGTFRHNNILLAEPSQIDRYFERYVHLADSIDQHGYLSRRDLRTKHRSNIRRRWMLERGEEEVGVAIGPKGEIWRYRGGYHRTAIARNLGLVVMPVMIKLVHEDCLRACLRNSHATELKEVCSVLVSGVH